MNLTMTKTIVTLKDWGALIGILVTLGTLIAVHMNDRALLQRHENLINAYENRGTPAAVEMRTRYDEKFNNTEKRLDRMETAINYIAEIRGDLRVINNTVNDLKVSLEEHRKTTAANYKASQP